MPMINEGRHYHSSCSFNNKFIYIFGGIENIDKKCISSIERLNFDINSLNGNEWRYIDLPFREK